MLRDATGLIVLSILSGCVTRPAAPARPLTPTAADVPTPRSLTRWVDVAQNAAGLYLVGDDGGLYHAALRPRERMAPAWSPLRRVAEVREPVFGVVARQGVAVLEGEGARRIVRIEGADAATVETLASAGLSRVFDASPTMVCGEGPSTGFGCYRRQEDGGWAFVRVEGLSGVRDARIGPTGLAVIDAQGGLREVVFARDASPTLRTVEAEAQALRFLGAPSRRCVVNTALAARCGGSSRWTPLPVATLSAADASGTRDALLDEAGRLVLLGGAGSEVLGLTEDNLNLDGVMLEGVSGLTRVASTPTAAFALTAEGRLLTWGSGPPMDAAFRGLVDGRGQLSPEALALDGNGLTLSGLDRSGGLYLAGTLGGFLEGVESSEGLVRVDTPGPVAARLFLGDLAVVVGVDGAVSQVRTRTFRYGADGEPTRTPGEPDGPSDEGDNASGTWSERYLDRWGLAPGAEPVGVLRGELWFTTPTGLASARPTVRPLQLTQRVTTDGRPTVAAGLEQLCYWVGDAPPRCFGSNENELFERSLRPLVPAPGVPIEGLGATAAMVLSGSHACALGADHRVRCWGENGAGELGLGDRRPRLRPTAVALPRAANALWAARAATCATLDDGAVHCWSALRGLAEDLPPSSSRPVEVPALHGLSRVGVWPGSLVLGDATRRVSLGLGDTSAPGVFGHPASLTLRTLAAPGVRVSRR